MSPGSAPFPGLVPFEESDAWLFHGRQDEVRVISANLHAARLTVLYGESGAGKSSLLNAGVAAKIRARTEADIKRWGKMNFAAVTTRTWSGDPIRELTGAVAKAVPGAPGGGNLESVLLAASQQVNGNVLVILDQFEEYFRYLDDGKVDSAFLNQFGALWSRDLRVNFLISLREDSLGVLERLKKWIPDPYENRVRLEHLTVTGARAAILEPIRACGEAVTFPEQLADRVLAYILGREAAGGDRLQASILQLVMRRWWDATPRLTAGGRVFDEAGLATMGGVEHIVRAHLRESLDDLSPEQQKLAARMFGPLVTESGRKIANTDRELAGVVRKAPEEVRAVAERLVAKRILSTTALPYKAPPADVCYEFRHDLIAGAALEWRKEQEKEEAEREAKREAEREADREAENRRLARKYARDFWLQQLPVLAQVALLLLPMTALHALNHVVPPTWRMNLVVETLVSAVLTFVLIQIYQARRATSRNLFRSAVPLFVGKQMAEPLGEAGEISSIGKRMMVTIMFSDIRGFTEFAETADPATVVNLLNEYLSMMTSIIVKHNGHVNKFIGEGILAVFSDEDANATPSDHALRAVRCGVEMLAAPGVFQTGIGIHTGLVTVGSVGSADKIEYTVMGDTVNLASRLESLNKEHHTKLMMSGETHDLIGGAIETTSLGEVPVRGKAIPV